MAVTADELIARRRALALPWAAFAATPQFERFVEFAVAVSSFTEFLSAHGLAGLHQEAHALEQKVLTYFEVWANVNMGASDVDALAQRVRQFDARIEAFIQGNTLHFGERRNSAGPAAIERLQPQRSVGLLTAQPGTWGDLTRQLRYFNIPTTTHRRLDTLVQEKEVTTVLLDHRGRSAAEVAEVARNLRGHLAASCIIACEVPGDFDSQKSALAAGCDYCLVEGTTQAAVIDRIVRVNEARDEAPYQVLVVEDSRTAAALIARTLSEGGMQSTVIHDPRRVLEGMVQVVPDLILMDMHMPGCNGVEVTRVLRQHPEFLSTPVVYLSGDSDIALQVDALRLGGDHFLTKPFNPVVLNAVVKSKIERYRALRKHMVCDSLTGLLNHTTCKQRLDTLVAAALRGGSHFCVAMVDIDHFKRVNDTYGHPVGDQVIRSMAWLLKQRLRTTDGVGRYGGEEFVLMLPESELGQLEAVLNAIREDFGCIVHEADGHRFQCSFSAGAAQWRPGESADTVLARADASLYAAKAAGRNRVLADRP